MACPRHTGSQFYALRGGAQHGHKIINAETGEETAVWCIAEKMLTDSKGYAEKYLWNLDAGSIEPFDEHDWLLAHAPGCADKPKETWGLAEWYAVADAVHDLPAEGEITGEEARRE